MALFVRLAWRHRNKGGAERLRVPAYPRIGYILWPSCLRKTASASNPLLCYVAHLTLSALLAACPDLTILTLRLTVRLTPALARSRGRVSTTNRALALDVDTTLTRRAAGHSLAPPQSTVTVSSILDGSIQYNAQARYTSLPSLWVQAQVLNTLASSNPKHGARAHQDLNEVGLDMLSF
jgi:hypothetical protein